MDRGYSVLNGTLPWNPTSREKAYSWFEILFHDRQDAGSEGVDVIMQLLTQSVSKVHNQGDHGYEGEIKDKMKNLEILNCQR